MLLCHWGQTCCYVSSTQPLDLVDQGLQCACSSVSNRTGQLPPAEAALAQGTAVAQPVGACLAPMQQWRGPQAAAGSPCMTGRMETAGSVAHHSQQPTWSSAASQVTPRPLPLVCKPGWTGCCCAAQRVHAVAAGVLLPHMAGGCRARTVVLLLLAPSAACPSLATCKAAAGVQEPPCAGSWAGPTCTWPPVPGYPGVHMHVAPWVPGIHMAAAAS
jgi:hypothetical protein